jgi:hypothetical protein
MHRGPAARADQAVRGLAGLDPVGLDPVGLADPADIRDRAGPAGLADLDLAGPAGLADLDLGDRGDNRADLVDPADLTDIKAPVGLADLDLAGRADLGDQGMNRVDRAGLADLDLAGRVALGGQADLPVRLDRQQRRTRPGVLSTGVVPRWAAPGMCRAASARPATVRRLRRHNTDGAGMAGLRPERRRLSGTDRRPRVDGAVLRLPVVGTAHGTGRRAISQSRSVISGRSITTGTTRSRCLTRFLGDGASGSLVSGSRCTDAT